MRAIIKQKLAIRRLTTKELRPLGILPLAFFCAQAIHYWQINEIGQMLWMCNVGNLLLALGLFLEEAIMIRVAVIWIIPGLAVWFLFISCHSGERFTPERLVTLNYSECFHLRWFMWVGSLLPWW